MKFFGNSKKVQQEERVKSQVQNILQRIPWLNLKAEMVVHHQRALISLDDRKWTKALEFNGKDRQRRLQYSMQLLTS